MEKVRVTVSIFGRDYSIVSDVDPENIKRAAEYLDTRMREVAGSYPGIPEAKIAVLAALNITGELFQTRSDSTGGIETNDRIGELTRKLSEIL